MCLSVDRRWDVILLVAVDVLLAAILVVVIVLLIAILVLVVVVVLLINIAIVIARLALLVLLHELLGDEVAAAEHHGFSDETHCDRGV